MVMTPQPTLEVPVKIAAGIAAGVFRRDGGVIRWADSGRIHTFLKDAVPSTEATERAPSLAASLLKSRFALVVGVMVAGAAAGTAAYAYLTRRAGENDVPEAVAHLNASLRGYMDAARDGSLDATVIDRLIADLDAVTERRDTDGLPVDFSSELWELLVALIVDHTQKLADAVGVEVTEVEQDAQARGDATVIHLRRHLEAQRRILNGAG